MSVKKSNNKNMKYLQFIVVMLFATALLVPQRKNRYVITAIALVGIICAILLFVIPKISCKKTFRLFAKAKPEMKSASQAPMSDTETLLWRQISFQITAKLQSAYPEATWDFVRPPKLNYLLNGKSIRIRTCGTDTFNFAEFHLDQFGGLDLEMMTISSLVRNADSTESTASQVDPESWYTLIGKPLLTDLIGDLQARGHQKLFINEAGEIYIRQGQSIDLKNTFEYFPPKNYWSALADIFMRDELEANETDNEIELSWMS